VAKARLFIGLILSAAAAGPLISGALLARYAFTPAFPTNDGVDHSVVIEIPKKMPAADVARTLETLKVVQNRSQFLLLGRILKQWNRIKAGEYKVSGSMTPLEVFAVITSGIGVGHPVTVREGENMFEIAADLEAKGLVQKTAFLTVCRDPQFIKNSGILTNKSDQILTLEGYLYPDTYLLNKTMTATDIATQMVRHFLERWTAEQAKRTEELGMTRHQLVTLASIVEKETGAPQDRTLVSAVFHNRLKKNMKLQSDPTTIYGIWEKYHGNLHKADLLDPSPFNTYYVASLPAGPISNPGAEAIQATLFPAEKDYLYFVSHNDGTSEFTSTLEAHNRAVQKYQLDPKAREGKSWRDLRKSASAEPTPSLHK
jgi:UPF0755 protein